jgi:hypothetical protein
MDSALDNNFPQMCLEVGLDCKTCTGGTARQLASVCKNLRGKMVAQLFVQIYPQTACAKMHGHFAAAYREATGELAEQAAEPEVPAPVRPYTRQPRVFVAAA